MGWTALPAGGSTPVTHAEAERIAYHYLYSEQNRERGDLVVVQEHEACFTVRVQPRPVASADPSAPPLPPANSGSGVSVIDKENAGVTFWPSWPAEVVAKAYQDAKAAGEVELAAEWPQAEG